MSKQIITDTNWRGVPCTLRYSGSLKPVCVGDLMGGRPVVGGTAPHKESSTGYMTFEPYESRYVNGCRWVEDYEPNAWAVMCRTKKKGRKVAGEWEEEYTFSIEHHGDSVAYLMAHGRARLLEFNPDLDCFVKAVDDPTYYPSPPVIPSKPGVIFSNPD